MEYFRKLRKKMQEASEGDGILFTNYEKFREPEGNDSNRLFEQK
jgi:hypothetical protein